MDIKAEAGEVDVPLSEKCRLLIILKKTVISSCFYIESGIYEYFLVRNQHIKIYQPT